MPGYSLPTELRTASLCASAADGEATEEQVSSTAAVIAASTLFLSRDKTLGRLVARRAAALSEQFVRALPRRKQRALRALSVGRLRPIARIVEGASVPGIQVHYALRKRHLEATAREFLRDGGEQVVVLGGGFDTLAIRLAEEHPHARIVEVDRAGTQNIKIAALGRASTVPRPVFLPLNLPNDRLAEALALRGGLQRSERSLVIAEGLLMYLQPSAVASLIGTVSQLGARGSLLAFTFMETDTRGRATFRNQSRALDLWLRLRGEPFAWGIARQRVAEFLVPFGFRVRELLTSAELRARYLPEAPHVRSAQGECVCVAERI